MPEFTDDSSIANECYIYRRINPEWIQKDPITGKRELNPDSGEPIVTTASFDNSKDGHPMSVHLGNVMEEEGITAEMLLADYPGYGMVRFPASLFRELNQAIVRNPTDDISHGLIAGNKTYSIKKRLKKNIEWVIIPED